MIQSLRIKGLRGFSAAELVRFALPNGVRGSGITVVVGPNGGGKSTVLEAMRVGARSRPATFAQGTRNTLAGDEVTLSWTGADGTTGSISSVRPGSSETNREPTGAVIPRLLYLPSRRRFEPFFGARDPLNRDSYSNDFGDASLRRGQSMDHFSGRLLALERGGDRTGFDELVTRIAGRPLDWSIDLSDSGQYFVKISSNGISHTSDGLGEGTVSLLFLADALYDSAPGDTIVIDEPELSLHPDHQRRLRRAFSEYATDRQIIVATHSPYLVGWDDIANGGSIIRVFRSGDRTCVRTPNQETLDGLRRFVRDVNNPHVLGLNASEVFFLEDNVILVEGQEDVVVYQTMASELGVELQGTFFGWGVGGADKMSQVALLLDELGYQHVVGILDANKQGVAEELRRRFPAFTFLTIPAADVRDKPPRPARPAINGLADSSGRIHDAHSGDVSALFSELQRALSGAT